MGEPLVQSGKLLGLSLGISHKNRNAISVFTYIHHHDSYIVSAMKRGEAMHFLRKCTKNSINIKNGNSNDRAWWKWWN